MGKMKKRNQVKKSLVLFQSCLATLGGRFYLAKGERDGRKKFGRGEFSENKKSITEEKRECGPIKKENIH